MYIDIMYSLISSLFFAESKMTQELIQNLIDVMDIAHNQRAELTELLPPLQEAQDQVL